MTPLRRLLILAFTTSVGFSSTTAMALWITTVDQMLAVPSWWGSIIGSLQLAGAASANLVTPYLFRRLSCEALARAAAGFAVISAFAMAASTTGTSFAAGAISLGMAFGVLLSCSNALLARSKNVQGSYSSAQICEVAFAATFYFVAGTIIAAFGLRAIFILLACLAIVVAVLMHLLLKIQNSPRDAPGTTPARRLDWRIPVAACGFILFFVGQSSFYLHQVAIGAQIGISHADMSKLMSIATFGGFCGALTSKIVGLRFGLLRPLIVTTIALSAVLVLVPLTNSSIVFALCAISIQALTMATVPYAFARFAELDATGRFPSRGPSLLLIGVAGGPLVAEYFTGFGGYALVGVVGAIIVACAGGLFALAAIRSVSMRYAD